MNILSLFKAPPESLDAATALIPESAIAHEVEIKIHALSVLCKYVGWSDVEKHLDLARKELGPFLGPEASIEEKKASQDLLASNVTPLKSRR